MRIWQFRPPRPRSAARYLQSLAIFLLVAVLFIWVLSQVPLRDAWLVLRRLSVGKVLALLLLNGLVLLALNGRWWLILRAQGYRLPFFTLTGHRLAAFGVSYFTPGPHFGGEPVQVALVEQQHGVPRATAVAAVTLDKLLELLVNFLFLALGVGLVLQQGFLGDDLGWETAVFPVILLLAIILFLAATWAGQYPITRLLHLLNRLPVWQNSRWGSGYQRVSNLLQESERQATRFCQTAPQAMFLALLVSMLSWALLIAEYAMMIAFLGVPLTPAQTIAMLTAARVAYLLPLPGGLGALEAGQVLMLRVLGFDPAAAVGASLLIRLRDVLLGISGLAWAAQRWSQFSVQKPIVGNPIKQKKRILKK